MGHSAPRILVYGPPLDGLDAGDAAVFQADGLWFNHELVERTDDGWLTQGSNEPHTDQWDGHPGGGIEPVTAGQVAGVAYLGTPLSFVAGLLAASLLALGVTGLYWLGRSRGWYLGGSLLSQRSVKSVGPVAVAGPLVLSAAGGVSWVLAAVENGLATVQCFEAATLEGVFL
jgi:hypothetical protein